MTTHMESCQAISPAQLWCAAPLPPRIQKLRDQFFSFYERDYTNEVRAYTTGTPWDTVYSIWSWTNVPEMAMFFHGARSYLLAAVLRSPTRARQAPVRSRHLCARRCAAAP